MAEESIAWQNIGLDYLSGGPDRAVDKVISLDIFK